MKNKILLLFTFLLSFNHFAGVNLKNGNFYITYNDISTSHVQFVFGDFSRTYNSKSTKRGFFGYGWGTQWETQLYFFPDGHISIHEYGAGGKTTFYSDLASQENIQMMVDIIIETKLEHNLIEGDPSAILELQKELINNLERRHSQWISLEKQNLLDYKPELIEGLVFEGHSRGNQKITILEDGFERFSISNQTKELFDLNGRLVKYIDKNGLYTEIEYIDNKISKMTCGDGAIITFKTNENGYITEAKLKNSIATFRYDGDNLVFSEDAGGNVYGYEYDKVHNLTKVIYNPLRAEGVAIDAMSITYEAKTYYCQSITERNGETTYYEYQKFFQEDGTEDPDRYSTTVVKEGYNGEKVKNQYEYFIKVGANGNRYTSKIISNIEGITTTTIYDEQCNLPTEIIRDNIETLFEYNNRCRLIRKTSTSGIDIEMEYHPTLEKLTYVRNSEGEFNFDYNPKGDLIKATKANGNFVELKYLENGKIYKMITNNETLLFEYNKIGKPISIEIENVGNIDVTYDEYGEIERVESEEGHSMSMKVTQAFQKLLAMVKPSGVNLNM